MMKPKEWLDENEWENKPIESEAWSHYTMLDTLLEEYAKYYMSEKLKQISHTTKIQMKKYL